MSGKDDRYRFSPRAVADLEEIWLYSFKTWSLERANRYHHEIIAVVSALAEGTKVGQPVDIREGYFKCPAGSHFVFYRHNGGSLDVIRVLHQRMDVSKHL